MRSCLPLACPRSESSVIARLTERPLSPQALISLSAPLSIVLKPVNHPIVINQCLSQSPCLFPLIPHHRRLQNKNKDTAESRFLPPRHPCKRHRILKMLPFRHHGRMKQQIRLNADDNGRVSKIGHWLGLNAE